MEPWIHHDLLKQVRKKKKKCEKNFVLRIRHDIMRCIKRNFVLSVLDDIVSCIEDFQMHGFLFYLILDGVMYIASVTITTKFINL